MIEEIKKLHCTKPSIKTDTSEYGWFSSRKNDDTYTDK